MKNVYFLSDAHLGSRAIEHGRTQERRLVNFLDSIKHKASAVYLLGDAQLLGLPQDPLYRPDIPVFWETWPGFDPDIGVRRCLLRPVFHGIWCGTPSPRYNDAGKRPSTPHYKHSMSSIAVYLAVYNLPA